jgi:hypothetical protein
VTVMDPSTPGANGPLMARGLTSLGTSKKPTVPGPALTLTTSMLLPQCAFQLI